MYVRRIVHGTLNEWYRLLAMVIVASWRVNT